VFTALIACAGNVEQWLAQLVAAMQATVKSVMRTALANIEDARVAEFIIAHPAQAALLAIQFRWTIEVQVSTCCMAVMTSESLTHLATHADML
jgi:hypothetical protein